jgi:hypothetical protein
MKILSFRELRVYQSAVGLAMEIFELTKQFPTEEKYSLIDQIRRSSVQFVLISPKLGENEDIKLPLLQRLTLLKPKLVKLRFSLN